MPTSIPTMPTNLLSLASRCEEATGPDVSLDGLITLATGRSGEFTASLDAAMTLVPEGWTGIIPVSGGDEAWLWKRNVNSKGHRCNAATPALALCAAALRARASSEEVSK